MIKDDKAKEADDALINAPQTAVDTRTRLLKEVESLREIMMTPNTANFSQTTGRSLMYAPDSGNLHETCTFFGKLNCIYQGYPDFQLLSYNLGGASDFLAVPDIAASTNRDLSVMVVTLDGTTEVQMSNELGAGRTINGNTFSTYIGDYYLAQDYDTSKLFNIDDDIGVYVNPAPYFPANLINGSIAPKPEDGDYQPPSAQSDTRFDFRLNDRGLVVTDIYEPQVIHQIKINSVTNDASFMATETLLSGDQTMVLDTVSVVNTTAMSVDVICVEKIERGNTGFQVSDKVQGLSSGAFGFVGSVNTSFRWSLTSEGTILNDNVAATIEGYEQDTFSQLYGTMNLVSYTAPDGDLFPAKIRLHHSLVDGVANSRDGVNYVGTGVNLDNLGPPVFGKTLPLRRWSDHETGLLAIVTARGLQMNLDWFVANNRHEGGLPADEITKMDNATWIPYLGWAANTDYDLVRAARPADFRSNTANSGTNTIQYYSDRTTGPRLDEHYPYIENNPFYPAGVTDPAPDSLPYPGIYVHWDDGANNISYAVHSELRWRYQPNPFMSGYDTDNPNNETFSLSLPGYFTGPQDGTAREFDLQTVNQARAPDALDAGLQRLIQGKYDQHSSNTGDFTYNRDGDTPGPNNARFQSWYSSGTTSFTVPASTTGTAPPFPNGQGNVNTYSGYVSQTITNSSTSQPTFSYPVGGNWYIKQVNIYGPKIWKVTSGYNRVDNGDGTYNHQLTWDSEEFNNEINSYARLFDSNDFIAVADTLKTRMESVAQDVQNVGGTNVFSIRPDGHWPIYFDSSSVVGDANNRPGFTTYNHGLYAGDTSIDLDRAVYSFVLTQIAPLRENRTEFNDQMTAFGVFPGSSFTFNFTHDTETIYLALTRIKDALSEWKTLFRQRIGYPVQNTHTFSHGNDASGYSKELYDFAGILSGDVIGTLKAAGNAIKNLDLTYDDVRRNRIKYRVYS